ncbi:putative F-box protein At1g50870 [Brassica napus]|uniref:putative F-box protein At1g50870 n=1 Tax=Brassica napus TaxID=3708 RepID=UPI0020790A1F|nr:putative F-box protein At1g50870 [Brassica napus]
MDRQQETTEQIHKKARIKSQESVVRSSFPLDLISEILSKLPAKSVGRFRCVSKLWSSVTTDPYFINKFETQSRQRKPSLLLTFKRADRLFVFSIPQDRQPSNYEYHSIASQPVHSYHMTYPKSRRFFPRASVHGLISCFQEETKPIIWNPTTRKLLTLTKPEKSWDYATFFLGYDPVDAKHKVLCMRFDETIDEYRVFALGSAQESWKRIKTSHKHYVNSYPTRHVCTNGFIYYNAYSDKTERFGFIMSFDVRSEEFHVIKLPCNNSRPGGILASYEGRLACVTHNAAGDGTILWTLMDAEKHEWSRRDLPIPIPFYDRSLETAFNFIGITDAGEFVYVPNRFRKLYYVLFYDPKRNKFHRVGFNGIADDESRLKHGLVNSRLYNIPVVMNHIESLRSF